LTGTWSRAQITRFIERKFFIRNSRNLLIRLTGPVIFWGIHIGRLAITWDRTNVPGSSKRRILLVVDTLRLFAARVTRPVLGRVIGTSFAWHPITRSQVQVSRTVKRHVRFSRSVAPSRLSSPFDFGFVFISRKNIPRD
jgi:hypothetical protein